MLPKSLVKPIASIATSKLNHASIHVPIKVLIEKFSVLTSFLRIKIVEDSIIKRFYQKTPQNAVLQINFVRKIYNMLSMITRPLWSKMEIEQIAEWAFMIFVVIAIIAGLSIGYLAWDANNTYPLGFADETVADYRGYVTLIMLILGIVVGIVSITAKEVKPFLIAAIALMVARIGIGTAADVWAPLGEVHMLLPYWSTEMLNYIVAFVAPAAVIIAFRAVYALAKEK